MKRRSPGERLADKEQLSERDFVEALVAALVMKGGQYLRTHSDLHQRRFHNLVETLEAIRETDGEVVRRMPRWYAGPVTCKFHEFDQALLDLQQIGVTRSIGPDFAAVELCMDPERAERYLDALEDQERQLILDLATVFVEAPIYELA